MKDGVYSGYGIIVYVALSHLHASGFLQQIPLRCRASETLRDAGSDSLQDKVS